MTGYLEPSARLRRYSLILIFAAFALLMGFAWIEVTSSLSGKSEISISICDPDATGSCAEDSSGGYAGVIAAVLGGVAAILTATSTVLYGVARIIEARRGLPARPAIEPPGGAPASQDASGAPTRDPAPLP
jgi:hypothetical protein